MDIVLAVITLILIGLVIIRTEHPLKLRSVLTMGMWQNTQDDLLQVNLGIIGKGSVGKTVMMSAIHRTLRKIDLGDSLEFGAISIKDTKNHWVKTTDIEQRATQEAIVRTVKPEDFVYGLRSGHKLLMKFTYHDAIGQLVTQVTFNQNEEEAHRTFISTLAAADILWIMVPVRKINNRVILDDREVDILKSYLIEILNKRGDRHVSVALVITKVDLFGWDDSPEFRTNCDKLALLLSEEFTRLAVNSDRVWLCSIFPVSAFGLNNSIHTDISSDESIDQDLAHRLVEPQLKPWNIDKLLLWSLASGLAQPKPRQQLKLGGSDIDIARRLEQVLHRTQGPSMQIKSILR